MSFEDAVAKSWDGVGDRHEGFMSMIGNNKDVFSLKDCGLL